MNHALYVPDDLHCFISPYERCILDRNSKWSSHEFFNVQSCDDEGEFDTLSAKLWEAAAHECNHSAICIDFLKLRTLSDRLSLAIHSDFWHKTYNNCKNFSNSDSIMQQGNTAAPGSSSSSPKMGIDSQTGMWIVLGMIGASAGFTMYTKRSGQMLRQLEHISKQQAARAPPRPVGPMTRQEWEKIRPRFDKDDLFWYDRITIFTKKKYKSELSHWSIQGITEGKK